MSVLVKNMKMPKDCPQCLLSSWSPITDEFLGCFAVPGKRYAVLNDKEYAKSTKRPDWCPLVELPEKHGRLIDGDALVTEMTNGIRAGNLEDGYEKYQNINNMDDCVECVKYADVVIEAEGE